MTDSANAHGPYISHLGHVPIVERLVKGDWECINNKQFPVRDDTDRPSTRLRERRAQTPRPSGNVINLQSIVFRNEQLVANDARRRLLTSMQHRLQLFPRPNRFIERAEIKGTPLTATTTRDVQAPVVPLEALVLTLTLRQRCETSPPS